MRTRTKRVSLRDEVGLQKSTRQWKLASRPSSKGLRKPKDEAGNLKIRHFERLPDKLEYPSYFAEIKDPIALDLIKKKAKRKKYQSIDHFMKDLDLLFKMRNSSTRTAVRYIKTQQTCKWKLRSWPKLKRPSPTTNTLWRMVGGPYPMASFIRPSFGGLATGYISKTITT